MRNRKPLSKKQKIFFGIDCLLPGAVFLLGVIQLFRHMIPTLSFLLDFVLLPAVWMLLVIRCWHTGKTIPELILLVSSGMIGALLFIALLMFGDFGRIRSYRGDEAHEQYAEAAAQHEILPSPDELGAPESFEFNRYHGKEALFSWDADVLICRYDESCYAEEKAQLDSQYIYQSSAIANCEPAADIEGYSFRLLDSEEYAALTYPEYIMLTAANDEKHEIVYICYRDPDLDYIRDLSGFILDSCGWKYMR